MSAVFGLVNLVRVSRSATTAQREVGETLLLVLPLLLEALPVRPPLPLLPLV
jgi:hypothetical protein